MAVSIRRYNVVGGGYLDVYDLSSTSDLYQNGTLLAIKKLITINGAVVDTGKYWTPYMSLNGTPINYTIQQVGSTYKFKPIYDNVVLAFSLPDRNYFNSTYKIKDIANVETITGLSSTVVPQTSITW